MAHVRKLLRDAVVVAVTGLATTGANVFVDRVLPLQETELPALMVAVGDQVELDGIGAPELQRRTFSVTIEARAKAMAGLSNTLDTIGAEVETTLAAAITVGGKSVYLTYLGTEAPVESGDADRPIGAITLTFELVAYTQADTPTSFL